MERLTEWKDDKKLLAKTKFSGDFGSANVLSKLAEYEEAEEQGLMVRLPVPIGTTVYEFEPLNKIIKGCTARTIIKYTIYDDSIWFNFADGYMKDIKDFGKTIFLTREAAEQQLKEYKNEKENERYDI